MAYTTINKSTDYFNTKLYTGNGSSSYAITGVGHQPDFVWIKKRDGTVNHLLHDSIRGVTKLLVSNTNAAEDTNTNILNSFDSDGFTVGSNSASNDNNGPFASWNWKANGAGSANTDGSTSSTVSTNTTSGFSIVKYTATGSNATVGHGLGVAPAMVILKNLDSARSWTVGHNGLTNWNYHCYLSSTNAENSDSTMFQGTTPTNTVFSVGTAAETNESGDNFIAYCFADVQGFSKFGSYVGNGSTGGTFVYTGFKPAFVMWKISSSAGNWQMQDTVREPFNDGTRNALFPDSSEAEAVDTSGCDFLSNGFKLRNAGSGNNSSGSSYIYMAFAEAPIVGTNGVTAKAR